MRALLGSADGLLLLALLGAPLVLAAVSAVAARSRGRSAIVAVPVYLVATAACVVALRLARRDLVPGYARAFGWVAVPVELALAAWMARAATRAVAHLRRSGHDADVGDALRAAVHHALGANRVADVLWTELSVLYYAFFARPRAGQGASHSELFRARRAGPAPPLPALLAVIAVETAAAHLVLAALHLPRLAWVSTAMGAYALVWLVADFRASRLRPVVLEGRSLLVRRGLRWTARVPLGAVARVRRGVAAGHAPIAGEGLRARVRRARAAAMADALVLELVRPVRAVGAYGFAPELRRVVLALEDAPRFERALAAAGIVVEGPASAADVATPMAIARASALS